MSEQHWIQWLRTRLPEQPRVPIGPGDDCALVSAGAGGTLVTVDMLIDGVHFDLRNTDPRRIGHKCLAVSLSDIAAMGGKAVAAFIAISLPDDQPEEVARALYEGLTDLADRFQVAVAGGDTNSHRGPLVVSVTVLGDPPAGGPVTRSGAGPGDRLFVTGPLGGSLAGHHLDFTPRLAEAALLLQTVRPTAMIDVSDGLATDLHHLSHESGCRIIIDKQAVPVSAAVQASGDQGLLQALTDGEDFELCFALSPEAADLLEQKLPAGLTLCAIGECQAGSGVFLRNGTDLEALPQAGYEHRFGKEGNP